jgi:hypothetical protein
MTDDNKPVKIKTILMNHKRKIICLSCSQEVIANLIIYADGYIATCPLCKKLAHFGK